jgi:hypothetical protein
MYILNNVYLECSFSRERVLWKEDWIFLCKNTDMLIFVCTYLGFGFLEAPREHVLHGPLLGIYWLWLCPHFGAPTPEDTLLRRRLFIVLMTAAHISPNVFSLQLSLASIYLTSYYNIQQCTHTYYTSHSHILYCITLYYMIHPCPSCIFISSVLPGRLAALSSLRPIQGCFTCFASNKKQQVSHAKGNNAERNKMGEAKQSKAKHV